MSGQKRNTNELVVRDKDTGELQIVDMYTGEVVATSSKDDTESEVYVFSYNKAMLICQEVAKGKTLEELGRNPEFPPLHVMTHWKRMDRMFSEELKLARKQRAEYFHDKIIDVAKAAHNAEYETREQIANAKLATDQFKWLAERGDPETFGSKVTHEGSVEKPIVMRIINTGITRNQPDVIATAKEVTHDKEEGRGSSGHEATSSDATEAERTPDQKTRQNGSSGTGLADVRSATESEEGTQTSEGEDT